MLGSAIWIRLGQFEPECQQLQNFDWPIAICDDTSDERGSQSNSS